MIIFLLFFSLCKHNLFFIPPRLILNKDCLRALYSGVMLNHLTLHKVAVVVRWSCDKVLFTPAPIMKQWILWYCISLEAVSVTATGQHRARQTSRAGRSGDRRAVNVTWEKDNWDSRSSSRGGSEDDGRRTLCGFRTYVGTVDMRVSCRGGVWVRSEPALYAGLKEWSQVK